MDIETFLSNVASGNSNEARENINDILSAKAFEMLDAQKQEMAQAMFSPETQETITEPETEQEQDTEQ
jgi:hypothetical protein